MLGVAGVMADDDEYERLLAGHDACNGVCGGGEQDKPLCPGCVCPGPKGTDTSQAAKHFSSWSTQT